MIEDIKYVCEGNTIPRPIEPDIKKGHSVPTPVAQPSSNDSAASSSQNTDKK